MSEQKIFKLLLYALIVLQFENLKTSILLSRLGTPHKTKTLNDCFDYSYTKCLKHTKKELLPTLLENVDGKQ